MNTEEKIKELLNECPVNKAHLTKDELSAYHQGLRCGAYNMAEWKEKEILEKVCEFLHRIDLRFYVDNPYRDESYNDVLIEDLKKAVKEEC